MAIDRISQIKNLANFAKREKFRNKDKIGALGCRLTGFQINSYSPAEFA
jgi:hypothetical protein